MDKGIAFITLMFCGSFIAGTFTCANGRSALKNRVVQKEQQAAVIDRVGADTAVIVDSVMIADTIVPADNSDSESDSPKLRRTIYSRNGRTIYFETADYMVYCYAQVGNDPPRKMIFGHEYGEDSFPVMYSHIYGDNVFVVGDFMPNSNGWTVRFPIYRINAKTFKMKFMTDGAAVHFGKDGFKVAHCRLTNPDANCTADERWMMHDTYYNSAGKKIREDRHEYDYLKMEEKYGDTLVNARKMRK